MRAQQPRDIIAYLEVPSWRLPLIAADMRRLKRQNVDSIPLFAGVELKLLELSQRGVVLAMQLRLQEQCQAGAWRRR